MSVTWYSQPYLHCPGPMKKGQKQNNTKLWAGWWVAQTCVFYMCKYRLANRNLTKFANYSALFPQVRATQGRKSRNLCYMFFRYSYGLWWNWWWHQNVPPSRPILKALRMRRCYAACIAQRSMSRATPEATGRRHRVTTHSVEPWQPPGRQQTKQRWKNAPTLLAILMAMAVRRYITARIARWRRSRASRLVSLYLNFYPLPNPALSVLPRIIQCYNLDSITINECNLKGAP